MPLLTMASAICRTNASVTLQLNLFQLFQPIGGVRASPLFRAWAWGTLCRLPNPKNMETIILKSTTALIKRILFVVVDFLRNSKTNCRNLLPKINGGFMMLSFSNRKNMYYATMDKSDHQTSGSLSPPA